MNSAFRKTAALLLPLLLSAGCGINDTERPPRENPLFAGNLVTLSADTTVAVTDTVVTVQLQAHPFLRGKGRVILQALVFGAPVVLEQPVRDTLGVSGGKNSAVLTAFFEIPDFRQEWQLRLSDQPFGYLFEGYVFMDSLWSAADSGYVAVDSPQARQLSDGGRAFRNWATTSRSLNLPALGSQN